MKTPAVVALAAFALAQSGCIIVVEEEQPRAVASLGGPVHAREAVSFALAAAAMRAPGVLLTTLEGRRDALQVGELLLEGFDILSEDFEEEQFFAETRRAYWAAAAGTARRSAAEAIIQKLEF